MTIEVDRHYPPEVETGGEGREDCLTLVLPGEGWAFETDGDVEAFQRELTARAGVGADRAAEASALALDYMRRGRLSRPCLYFIPAVDLRFQPSRHGARGDRDVDFRLHMEGWTFRDEDAKREFDRRLNLLDSPVLPGREAILDNAFLDTVRDGIEQLLLDVFDEGLVVPFGATRLTLSGAKEQGGDPGASAL